MNRNLAALKRPFNCAIVLVETEYNSMKLNSLKYFEHITEQLVKRCLRSETKIGKPQTLTSNIGLSEMRVWEST